jgi:hypothetical protein
MPKSYRIRTEVGQDKYINVNLEQDWESLEILSLKILANDLYTRFCADYGVVVGRVFVNNGFGLPNAKVSVFIPLEEADELNPVISELYPYKSITDTNEEGYRYNLLPKLPSYNGHTSTGSFPNKGDVLMDNSYIEVYDKYYRFTVTTNESGDFMIFGVPVGTQTIVMDVDLSDIGCFSLAPQDLIQQGLATETQVNGARFKSSTNLRELPQIKNLVFDVDVRPFWGDAELCQVGITRVDFDLTKQANINIQPTAIFMGSIISTTDDDALKVSCKPKNNTGNLCELVAGPGEIQAIRQTIFSDVNGLPILERYEIEEGGKVIDDNGTYLLNVPMNLDYVFTNEFGQQVISNDPTKGIPTKGKYRFKFKWQNEQGLQGSFLRADFLVPNVKEYGWINSNTDPFDPNNAGTYNYTLAAGQISGFTAVISQNVGFASPQTTNVESYQILINGQVYLGSIESIQLNVGDQFQIIATPVNPSSPQSISFTSYPQDLFDVYKSYAFSTDWDDYANTQDAIDCEDTFYEFKYNKVYTTAMFLDRYKNGIGRAKHLGIKEIDNRSCKSTVNTFPVNDIIKNFDPIFFVFNILINILTFPILVLLFVAHFISFIWPILKYVLIILGIVLTRDAFYSTQEVISNSSDIIETQLSAISVSLAGPVVDTGAILKAVRLLLEQFLLIAKAAFSIALAATFTAFAIFAAVKIKGFPRIGLPMISYPDCTSCDCDCKNADMSDDFDTNSVQNEIDEAAQNSTSGGSQQLSTPNTLIAPVNYSASYNIEHPNFTVDANDNEPFAPCKSLVTLVQDDEVTVDVVARATLDFTRIASGYDAISSTSPNEYISPISYLLKAPQPFLFTAKQNSGKDERYFGYPTSVTFSQKLNEFNTRDKYFKSSTSAPGGTGVNRIKTTVNPTLGGSTPYEDQVVVVLMNQGSTLSLGVGNFLTFQNPQLSGGLNLLTGATTNQFDNNAITGTTITGQTAITINYADPSNPNGTTSLPATIQIVSPQVSQLPVSGNSNVEQSFLKYTTDMEYFQLVTGMTVNNFLSLANQGASGFYPSSYLLHNISFTIPACNPVGNFPSSSAITDVIKTMYNYENFEVCVFVRGVDPFSPKQEINYDLSRIFGKSYGTGPSVTGNYYLNIPIQALPSTGLKPAQHDTPTNNVSQLYFPSYTFSIDPSQYSGFTSNLPYYYLNTDDTSAPANATLYTPVPSLWPTNNNSTTSFLQTNGLRTIPLTQNYYMVGGTYLGWFKNTFTGFAETNDGSGCNADCQKDQYYGYQNGSFIAASNGGNLSALYSPAYYRYGLPGVNFNNPSRIVMRSDRLPTSTDVQNGAGPQTGFALHQNDNFAFFTESGVESQPVVSTGGDLINGESFDLDPDTQALTNTLTCEGMVPLACYSGSGQNVGVVPQGQCSVPTNRMINGCYCLLNYQETNIPVFRKLYLIPEYFRDARLFLEWKTRFTMNFAACRGVFAQVFQNNWINGTLYMFNFNKRTTFNGFAQPNYDYCEDVILYNEISNTFYYRSSPWNDNTQQFVGKNSPIANPNLPQSILEFPGLGYNQKQIQFPTTVVDLGPRDSFINEICCSGVDGFGSYYSDELKATSYQDNSDIIQLGFLSRILNEGVRQRMLPITVGDNSTEGKGIIQFFNSTRGGYRIDGDWSQMLSINSEWKVSPFITENIPNNTYIYFGDNQNGTTGQINSDEIKPIMGLFFSSNTNEERYRKIMSPGIETYSFNPLIEEKFGYSKSQEVPHYRWTISLPQNSAGTPNIFGSEDNNWYTNTFPTGFTKKRYQDLDFTSPQEKYITPTTRFGFISNFLNNNPDANSNGVVQGQPVPVSSQGIPTGPNALQSVVVGAPYHFYFGLNNGKTAINRFYKLYVATGE